MPLHFDLLGPLTVSRDGRPVALGSTKQQLVLAALLLRPGEAISAKELMTMVWGDQPPASAAANLRTYLRGLRQALDCAAGERRRILTTPGGYLLRVEPDERDVDRFDAAAARGRAALAAGDPAAAQPELALALGMWRGPAFAGLPLPRLLSGRVARITERRLLTEEDHAAARLALGEAAQVIPRLRALLDRHPLRQRAWSQLMTGLYQIGDIAGAMAAFQQARRALAEETGMDPGPELTRLHDDILHHRLGQQGATTRPADDASAGAAPGRPQQLPLALPGFVGRSAELDLLDATLGARPERPATVDIVTISGMAGVGKTTLARALGPSGRRPLPRRPAVRQPPRLRPDADAVSRRRRCPPVGFLEALGVPAGQHAPQTVDAQAGLYRSLLAGASDARRPRQRPRRRPGTAAAARHRPAARSWSPAATSSAAWSRPRAPTAHAWRCSTAAESTEAAPQPAG